ncbi:MAG: dimethylargininase [Lysobacteraceae bacterium]|nr:MAG: dimethylargininase [Xanthomonadaceae bacterium]
MRYAVTRSVGDDLSACELSFVDRHPIDVVRATAQHLAYQHALREIGCELIVLPALPGHPDAVFVEDVALALDEVAVITRPGAASRRAESTAVEAILCAHRPLLRIEPPGTLDGGDILRIGRKIYLGASARSNAAGHAQLTALLGPFGYQVHSVEIRDCLHLKSAVTQVAANTVLIQPGWVDSSAFKAYGRIEVDGAEAHAANALAIGDSVIYPANFPRTAARLEAHGLRLRIVEVDELQKAEGAVTCCSLVFDSEFRSMHATDV